jgi:hypothetical protein
MHRHELTTDETSCRCPDCTSGKRNRFFPQKRFGVEEFQAEQDYLNGRRHLINRAVLGWGAVEGLGIAGPRWPCRETPVSQQTAPVSQQAAPPPAAPGPAGPLKVQRGLALDHQGRELLLGQEAVLTARNTFLLGADGCHPRDLAKLTTGTYLLAAHYAERPFGDAPATDDCGCGEKEKRFICETVVFSLTPLADDCCPCAEGVCARGCSCSELSCCTDCGGRHACLCQWAVAGEPPAAGALCPWHRRYRIAADDAVPLGCVRIEALDGACDPGVLGWVVDDCGPRRLVKGNDLLYDLLRGCDLVRVEWTSWQAWDRGPAIPWKDFRDKLRHRQGDSQKHFTVRFSGPVLVESLHQDAVVMTVFTVEQSTGWLLPRRIPVVALEPAADASLPAGTATEVRLQFEEEWMGDETSRRSGSWLSQVPFAVEIEIRGDRILSCQRVAVDANGNGTPGGTRLSSFQVLPKPSYAAGAV